MLGNGAVKFKTIDEHDVSFLVNGHRLKVYTNHVSWRTSFLEFLKEKWK